MSVFGHQIIMWYKGNSRVLPWRSTKEPYKIWLSEIILQQTRVAQGLSYYEKFVKEFPNVSALANASEQKVLKLWQGLGYYSRARNLHFAAKQIVNDYDNEFPKSFKEIKKLKGVGDYTAAAIASFAFDLPHAVVDGNVYRLLSRYFEEYTPIDSTAGKKWFAEKAQELMVEDDAATFNQAIMEIGAMVCTPKKPDCENCPVNENCSAFLNGSVELLPVKAKKTKVTKRYLNYFVLDTPGYLIQKRGDKGIWRNMFEFPMLETEKLKASEVSELGFELIGSDALYETQHVLSHQKLTVKFWLVDGRKEGLERYLSVENLEEYPIPRVIDKFLEESGNYRTSK